jgi:hypothetical protein
MLLHLLVKYHSLRASAQQIRGGKKGSYGLAGVFGSVDEMPLVPMTNRRPAVRFAARQTAAIRRHRPRASVRVMALARRPGYQRIPFERQGGHRRGQSHPQDRKQRTYRVRMPKFHIWGAAGRSHAALCRARGARERGAQCGVGLAGTANGAAAARVPPIAKRAAGLGPALATALTSR